MPILESIGLTSTPWIYTTAGKITVTATAIAVGYVGHRLYTREKLISDSDAVINEMEKLEKELKGLRDDREDAMNELISANKTYNTAKRKGKLRVKAVRRKERNELSSKGVGIFWRKYSPATV